MTYLEMVQKAIKESGAHVDLPATLVGITGVTDLIAGMVADAWEHSQLERTDWLWRTKQHVTGTLREGSERFFIRGEDVADNEFEGYIDYTQDPAVVVPASVSHEISEWTLQLSASDELRPTKNLTYVKWHEWDRAQDSTESPAEPYIYTINPEGVLMFFPIPDQDYRLYMSAPLEPQVLEDDEDVPQGLPTHLHKGLVWRAVLYYGMYHQDASIIEKARTMYRPYKKWLERSEMPAVGLKTDALYTY